MALDEERKEVAGRTESSPGGAKLPADKGSESPIRDAIVAVLKTVYDPEIPVNIYEIGLVYELDVDAEGNAKVRMTLTSPACPVAETLPPEVEQKIRAVPGVTDVDLQLVWEPPWNPSMMSDEAKLILNLQ